MVGFVIGVFALAGMIKGAIGLGLPAVAMGLLTLFISPFQAATFPSRRSYTRPLGNYSLFFFAPLWIKKIPRQS